MTYLLKIFNFGTLKVMKTCPGIRFFGEILSGLGFALAEHPYPGADLDRFIRFTQTCQSFSQKIFLECVL